MATAPTGVSIPSAADGLHRMHVTRPKSAKGRTRTTPQSFSHSEDYSYPASPSPRVPTAQPITSPRIVQEDVAEFLHQLPARPASSSLNRYRVLPSIGAAGSGENSAEEELARQTSCMRLASGSHNRRAKALYRAQVPAAVSTGDTGRSTKPHAAPETFPVSPNLQEPSDQEPRLLLALRSHAGQRFEWHFRPSDTIQTVLAVVEMKTGTSCENCIVESMEVPRRSFPDLSRTLQECRIPNKSVLCIHQTERD
ncbi:UBX domain-containing protein 10 [Spea bombifrons]|uniref:UBX domain-containing protein 10 n=1 Tax=Spea bombifrons TaxID=233779 RepID=UPI002348FCDB|nr:UBX domain-containing protein 10 [Spea bombifrons]XP_053307629.1 UBX domain-containing protein 10 [Spea bombifrons]